MAVTIILLLTVTLATFAADRILPLGVAVWLLYLVPVVLTTQLLPQYTGVALGISSGLLLIGMLDSKEGISYELALINRGLGLVVLLFTGQGSQRDLYHLNSPVVIRTSNELRVFAARSRRRSSVGRTRGVGGWKPLWRFHPGRSVPRWMIAGRSTQPDEYSCPIMLWSGGVGNGRRIV